MAYKQAGNVTVSNAAVVTLANLTVNTSGGFVDIVSDNTTPNLLGSNHGYAVGGQGYTVSPSITDIERVAFASDSTSSNVGNMAATRSRHAEASSPTHGYIAGGSGVTNIDRFPFTSSTNTSGVGNLALAVTAAGGASSSTAGYAVGGSPHPTLSYGNDIQKYPFASSANATDIGSLQSSYTSGSGCSSSTDGYFLAGWAGNSPAYGPYNRPGYIEKFPFATDTNATHIGDLEVKTNGGASWQSQYDGYLAGGQGGWDGATSSAVTAMQKFPFANGVKSSLIGYLSRTLRGDFAGVSSTTNGYGLGGYNEAVGATNDIHRTPFSTDTNATDVGNLVTTRFALRGNQN